MSHPDPAGTWDHLFFPPARGEYTYFQANAFIPSAQDFQIRNALWSAEWAMLAYGRFGHELIGQTEFHSLFLNAGFNDVQRIGDWEKAPSGTQGYFAHRSDYAVLSFRGTEKSDWLDLAADLFAAPTLYSDEPPREGLFGRVLRTIPRVLPSLLEPGEIGVHSGFLVALDSVWNDVKPHLDRYRQSHPGCPIVFTGHSLGAALATIAVARHNQQPSILYTYGSPRVGNARFRNRVEHATGGHIYRIADGSDLVTTVPPKSDVYEHVSTKQIHLTAPGQMATDESASTAKQETVAALADVAKAAVNLVDGDGPPVPLRDHSPLFYLNRIKSAIV